MIRRVFAPAAVAVALASPAAQAQNVQVGVLNCEVSGGIGLIVTMRRSMACTFTNSRGEFEIYTGRITNYGLDIGATAGGQLVWNVFAPSGRFSQGALTGTYAGVGAEASVGVGLGADALFGGSNRSVALQPLALQGQVGLNVAAGVTEIQLSPGRPVN